MKIKFSSDDYSEVLDTNNLDNIGLQHPAIKTLLTNPDLVKVTFEFVSNGKTTTQTYTAL